MPEKPSKLMPALYGGIIIGLLSGIPFISLINCICCAGVIIGGFLAVFFYKKDLPPDAPPLTNNDALALGALAGLFGALFSNIISAGFMLTIGNVAASMVYDVVVWGYDKAGILDKMPPEALDDMKSQMHQDTISPMNVLGSFITLPLFGLIGGLIGYAVYKPKKEEKTPEGPTLPPMEIKN
ncbi:MAG: hypothetical protein IPI01_19585 [Ignavibacteriae bacterium]|nr:hypothetical protein [Ignavibacteriota bacterium]